MPFAVFTVHTRYSELESSDFETISWKHLYIQAQMLYPPKIGRISDVVRSGRGSEFVT